MSKKRQLTICWADKTKSKKATTEMRLSEQSEPNPGSVPTLDLTTSAEHSISVIMPLQQLDSTPNSPSLQTSSVQPNSVHSLTTASNFVSNPSRETTPSDINTKYPTQPRLPEYPKSRFGDRLRSFDSSWYEQRPWLEYSALLDCCFCFTCRVFGTGKKNSFCKGFSDWKHALSADKGLNAHKASKQHETSYNIWVEKQKREDTGTIISNSWTKTTSDQLRWLEAVFIVTRHLASNGLPFRGDVECYDVSQGLSGGLFLNTFSDLLFYFQPDLKEIALRLPKNSTYLTKDIQNEAITVLAELVHQKVADEVKIAKFFTIMVDGTTDKSFQEMQGLVVRYFSKKEEDIVEKALDIGPSGRTASDIFQFVRTSIEKYGLTFDGLVSQAYDGASVMSGNRKGLQKLMSDHCLRLIIYIHCLAHRLNLVVKNVIDGISDLKEYFGIVSSVYSFFKLSNVRAAYDGTSLKRLIDTRWSGHLDVAKSFEKNYMDIRKTLKSSTTNKKLEPEQRALASGLLTQVSERVFVSLTCYVGKILKIMDILNKILQSSKESLLSALNAVQSTRDELQSLRNGLSPSKIGEAVSNFCDANGIEQSANKRRSRGIPARFSDFIIMDALPGEKVANVTQILWEFLDTLEEDFQARFSEENNEIWCAMDALLPNTSNFLNSESLKPLFEYMKVLPACIKDGSSELTDDDLKAECSIFRRVLSSLDLKSFENNRKEIDIIKIAAYLNNKFPEPAPILCNLYLIAITAGYVSARVECLFSSLTAIDTPQRRSMTSEREADLTYLLFERKTLSLVTFDSFLREWRRKPRKMAF